MEKIQVSDFYETSKELKKGGVWLDMPLCSHTNFNILVGLVNELIDEVNEMKGAKGG